MYKRQPLFVAVNSYATGLSPAVMEYMRKTTLVPRFGGKTSCDEIDIEVTADGYLYNMVRILAGTLCEACLLYTSEAAAPEDNGQQSLF